MSNVNHQMAEDDIILVVMQGQLAVEYTAYGFGIYLHDVREYSHLSYWFVYLTKVGEQILYLMYFRT